MTLSVEALADLQDIEDFIAGDSIEAAQRTVDVIFERLRVLESFPEAGRPRPDVHADVRSWPIQGYVVFYRILLKQERSYEFFTAIVTCRRRSYRRMPGRSPGRKRSSFTDSFQLRGLPGCTCRCAVRHVSKSIRSCRSQRSSIYANACKRHEV